MLICCASDSLKEKKPQKCYDCNMQYLKVNRKGNSCLGKKQQGDTALTSEILDQSLYT